MFSRNIKCPKCGQEGKVEAVDTVDVTKASELFKTLGKDSSGFLHFLCPACSEDISIDPFSLMDEDDAKEFRKLAIEESLELHLHRVKSTTINLTGIWLLAFIFSIISIFSHSPIWQLIKIGLFILMISMLLKISNGIKTYYKAAYFGYRSYPSQRRNVLWVNYANVVLISFMIILTIFSTGHWLSVAIVLLSSILLIPIILWVESAKATESGR